MKGSGVNDTTNERDNHVHWKPTARVRPPAAGVDDRPPDAVADGIFGEDQDGPWAACDQCDWRERYPSERERDWYARWHSTEMCIREQQRLSERVIRRRR